MNLLHSFWMASITRVSRKTRSTAEKRSLWGHGDRKMNLSHWIERVRKDEECLEESIIAEDEHSREESHGGKDMIEAHTDEYFAFPHQPISCTKKTILVSNEAEKLHLSQFKKIKNFKKRL